MSAYQGKVDIFNNLVGSFEGELQWIIGKQYADQPHYCSLLAAIQELPSHHEDSLGEVAREMALAFQELAIVVGERIKSLVDHSLEQVIHLREKMEEDQAELQRLRDKVETLEYTQETLLDKVDTWEAEYEVLKTEAIEMQATLEQDIVRVKREKKQISRTFIKVQEDSEQERQLLENMQVEELERSHRIEEDKREKEELVEEVDILKRRVDQSERKVRTSERKASEEERRIAMLNEELADKNQVIQEFYKAQRSPVEPLKAREIELMAKRNHEELNFSEKTLKRMSEVETFKLGDLVSFTQEEFERGERINRDSTNSVSLAIPEESVIVAEQEQNQERERPMVPDLYLAHYLLTVQSMKLKMNQEQLFNLDMAPFYEEVLERVVPFHEWDEWIKTKMTSMKIIT